MVHLLLYPIFLAQEDADDEEIYGPENVLIRTKWDNHRLHHEIGLPMHMAWNSGESSTTVDALLTESQPFNRAYVTSII